jgi:hypothetical protein
VLPDSPVIFSRSGCFVIKPLDVSSYWEAVSRAASQILRILGSTQFHYLSTNTPPSEPFNYKYSTHARETGLLRSTLILSCLMYLGLPLVYPLQVFFFYIFLVFHMCATFHMANVQGKWLNLRFDLHAIFDMIQIFTAFFSLLFIAINCVVTQEWKEVKEFIGMKFANCCIKWS